MKSVLVLTLLVAVAVCWGASNDKFQVDKIDEYFFKFLEGMNVHLNYEKSQICQDATYDIKSQFLYDANIVIKDGQIERDFIIALAKTISVLPDFVRHCDGTVSYMFTGLMNHFEQFNTFAEFQQSFLDNIIYQIFLLKTQWEQAMQMIRDEKVNEELFLLMGQMVYKTFNFNNTQNNLLLAPAQPKLEERLL